VRAQDDNLATVRRLNDKFASGDIAGAFDEYHEDLVLIQPESLPHGGAHVGHEGVRRAGQLAAEHWKRKASTIERVAVGDVVVLFEKQEWTALSTGRSVTVPMIEIFSFTDGKISRIEVFVDTHLVMQTLERPTGQPAAGSLPKMKTSRVV
jgi:uncharacterized protein